MAAGNASPFEYGNEVVSVHVTVAARAQRDTDEHVAWLAKHASDSVANRFFEAVLQTIDEISELPDSGMLWEPEDPFEMGDIQIFCRKVEGFRNHLVFYRRVESGLRVLRVVHGARDLGRISWSTD